jgi:hypothetical protein
MPYEIRQQEYVAVTALPAPRRYDHFIKRAADWGEVWSLKTLDGWVLVGDDSGRELVPVWPHPEYARACAPEWPGAEPERIALEDWVERWLPGIERDLRAVAVFPTPGLKGAVVEPSRMAADLAEELSNFESSERSHDFG